MSSYIVCAFYTTDTPYEAEAKKLEADCVKCGIDFYSVGYPNTGSWVRNAGYKPRFISEMLHKFPYQNIVYIDADARIRRMPTLFNDFAGDIGVHYRNGQELLSGTVFLKNNKRVRELVRKWEIAQAKNIETWDQRVLQRVIAKDATCEVQYLPPTYTLIFDTMKHLGRPVIEHFQASRKFKKIVEMVAYQRYPKTLGRVRVREAPDGTIYITRHDKTAEDWLDKNAERLDNQLRWRPKYEEWSNIEALKGFFDQQTCYIVGKGPSLDHLDASIFGEGPVIGLNEAVHKLTELGLENKLFGLQQDAKLRNRCYTREATMLVSTKAANFYAKYENVYVFDNKQYRLSANALSVSAAIEIAKSLGVKDFVLVAFDSCVNGALTYAKCVGYDVTFGGRPERFKTHRAKINNRLGKIPTQWVIPATPVEEAVDKPQQ